MTTIGELLKQYEDENEITVLEAGTYRLQVTSAKKRKGNDDIMPVFKVVDGPFKGKRVMAGVLSLAGNASGIFFQNMAGFGLGKEFFTALGPSATKDQALEAAAEALKGRIVDVELYVDDWKGQSRNKISIGKIKLIEAPAQNTGQVAGVPVTPTQGGAPVLPDQTTVAAAAPAHAPAAPAAVIPQQAVPPAPAPAAAVQPDPPPAVVAPLPAEVAQSPEPAVQAAAPAPTPSVPVDDPGF